MLFESEGACNEPAEAADPSLRLLVVLSFPCPLVEACVAGWSLRIVLR